METSISYYPWVPWILFFMAFMLTAPHMVWQTMMPNSGLNLAKLVSLADSHEDIGNLSMIIRIWLVRTKRSNKTVFSRAKKILGSYGLFWLGKGNRTYLAGLAIAVKWLYFLVSIGLFSFLNIFLQVDYFLYGIEVIESFLYKIPRNSATFPKNTICDFQIRQMSNIQTYSIQCVLPINMYNEYIFIFLWFWIILLCIVNAYSLLKWCFNLLSPLKRRDFVKHYASIVYRFMKDRRSRRSRRLSDLRWPALNSGASPHIEDDGGPRRRIRIDSIENLSSETSSNGDTSPRIRPNRNLPLDLSAEEFRMWEDERQINRITNRMIKHFGHDGVVVFRTLEACAGVVTANQIFQELYEQLTQSMHYN